MSFLDDFPEPEPEPDYEPDPHERVWFKHRDTGDMGYFVRRDGQEMVRYDRGPNTEMLRPLDNNWTREPERKLMTGMQLVRIAYEADRALCHVLGLHEEAKKEWLNLPEKERIAWAKDGPKGPPLRGQLFRAHQIVLGKVAG